MGKASRKKKKVSGEVGVPGDGSGASKKSPAGKDSRFTYYAAVLVSLITFLVYLKSLRNGFVNWDDPEYVIDNPHIHSLNLTLLKWSFGDFYQANWHPLTWFSHAVDYALWGLNPLGHHLTNNIFHALNTFMTVLLVAKLMEVYRNTSENKGPQPFLKDRAILIAASVTGLLFGLHPLHVESVAWVAERKDVLCAFFFLLTIITYTRYVIGIGTTASVRFMARLSDRKYLLAIGFFVLALLSKPMAVTLPLVLLILDWYPFRRIRSLGTFWPAVVEKLPLFVLSLISSILTIQAQAAGGAVKSVEAVPLAGRAAVAAEALLAYLGKMLLPLNLVPFYPYPEKTSIFSFGYIVPIVAVMAITAACVAVMRSHKLWLAAWGYYVITLLPVLGIVQVGGQAMADRYTYLPSLGPFLVIGAAWASAYEKTAALDRRRAFSKTVWVFIAMTVVVSLSYATVRQIGIWKDSIVLWNYAIGKEPGRLPFAHYDLGNAYSSKGQLDMAMEQYQTAIRLKPDYADAHNNLGEAYRSKGQLDMAMEQYQTAIRLKPDYAEAHNNLGIAYSSKGQLDMAIEQYRTALELKPNFAEAYNNLGITYSSQGRFDMAIKQYQAALRLKPDLAEAHNNLGMAYSSKGQFDMAIEQYQAALQLKPDYAEAHFHLGFVYFKNGSKDMARREFEAGLKSRPDYPGIRRILNSLSQGEH